MFCLEQVGFHPITKAASYDVRLRNRAFCGLIAPRQDGTYRVWFNSNATRGSARKFADIQAALAYIVARRIKKGWAL